MKISKTKETLQLEHEIYWATRKMGTFGCFEVTIGKWGNERVDYLTWDTKGTWRCYEIKVSKNDFYRGQKPTFIGHYNYYVLTKELYKEVYNDIPAGIGVYVNGFCAKKAKRRELGVEEEELKYSMIRSLFREFDKIFMDQDKTTKDIINDYKREIAILKLEKRRVMEKYNELRELLCNKYGYDEYFQIIEELNEK